MSVKKETSSSQAGLELAEENKGLRLTFCQDRTIKQICPSCKFLLAIILWQRMMAAFCGVPVVDPGRKLLPAPKRFSMKEKIQVLQHSLGVDQYGQGEQYRNHFATGPDGKDWDICQELVFDGFMQRHAPREIFGGYYCFVVTRVGIHFMVSNSPVPPKLSRSQRRYREYLEQGDTYENFGSFLKHRQYLKKQSEVFLA